MKLSTIAKTLAAVSILVASLSATAGTATATFAVSSTIVSTCTVTAAALNFGATIPTPVNSNVDVASTVTATCSNTAPYTIAMSAGNGTGATFATRKMSSGVNTVDYSLYTDSGRTTVWGDGTSGSSVSNQTGTGSAQAVNVYGRITSGQTPAVGAYSDTITATVTF